MRKNVSELFNKFAGKEVDPSKGKLDPVVQGMTNVAKANGLTLRVWYPGSLGTMDYRTDRVNAHVVKSGSKFIVQNSFMIG